MSLFPIPVFLSRSRQIARFLPLLCLFSVLELSHCLAQEALWGKFLDSEHGSIAIENRTTQTGEVVLFGYYTGKLTIEGETLTPKYNNSGSFIIKLSADGTLIEAFQVDGRYAFIENAFIDSNGDVVVAGRFNESIEFGGQEYFNQASTSSYKSSFTAKYSKTGAPLWLKIFPNSGYTSVALDEDDNVYILSSETMGFFSSSSFLRKYNTHGDLLFENNFLPESEVESYPMCLDVRNGEVIVGGMVYGGGTIFNSLTYTGGWWGFYVAMFNGDGSIKWAKKIGQTTYNNAYLSDIMFSDDGSFYMSGGLSDNMLLAKYDPQGNILWSKKSLPQKFSAGYLCKGIDGSIFLATNFYAGAELDGHVLTATPDSPTVANAPNVALIKFDEFGNVLGLQQLETHILNWVTSISASPFDEIYICGYSDAPALKVGTVNVDSPNDPFESDLHGYVVKFDGSPVDIPGFQILTTEVCQKESNTFSTTFNANEIKEITWDFGDPASGNQNSSSQLTPAHTYNSPGVYKVRAVITDTDNKKWNSSMVLEVHQAPQISLGADFNLCEGQTRRLEAGSGNDWTYVWQDGSTNSYFEVITADKYWVTVNNLHCKAEDTVVVNSEFAPNISIADKTLCPGQIYTVDLNTTNASILWSDGNVSKLRNIEVGGSYTVTATNECGSSSDSFIVEKVEPLILSVEDGIICPGNGYVVDLTSVPANLTWSTGGNEAIKEFFDSGVFTVQATNSCETKIETFAITIPEPFEFDLGSDRYMCNSSEPIVLQVTVPGAQYKWNDGTTSTSIHATAPGMYWVEINNGCYTVWDSVEIKSSTELTVPNIFTPNGDPLNEFFTVDESIRGCTLMVFNRWGAQVYASENYNNDWNANGLESAIYYYIVPEYCIKGWVQVVR